MKRLLIANRGEIACRIIHSARKLGLETVAVYSEADRHSLHVQQADQAFCIGPAAASASYLDQPVVLEAARRSGADAIHPGYGFLAENAAFAQACADAGLVFVGPTPEVIVRMGEKHAARRVAEQAGVPVLPGSEQASDDPQWLRRQALALGLPLMLKPVAGGGGKGMRRVSEESELDEALAAAMREGQAAFGDGRLLLERYLQAPRHVEVQVLADQHGHAVHLFERDCSLQRRHQKIIEESPAPGLDAATRQALGEAALKLVRATGYTGAGTVEFLLDDSGWYFMEMNTRLQVEHPVTEAVTGVDLVAWQLKIAAGEPLTLRQDALNIQGHAIELRLCAEDPARGFLPQTGRLERLRFPSLPGLRVDSGFRAGDVISPHYDSLLAKLIVHGESRQAALGLAEQALRQLCIHGVISNREALLQLLRQPAMRKGEVHVQWLDQHPQAVQAEPLEPARALAALALWQALQGGTAPLSVNGPARFLFRWQVADAVHTLCLTFDDKGWAARLDGGEPLPLRLLDDNDALLLEIGGQACAWQIDPLEEGWQITGEGRSLRVRVPGPQGAAAAAGAKQLHAPMPGQVLECRVKEGDSVEAGQTLLVLEAMKMEHRLQASDAGQVKVCAVAAGDRVQEGQLLLELE